MMSWKGERPTMRQLAGELQEKFFREVSDDIALVVSSDTANKAYLSGYVSMAHDLAPSYRSAALVSRDRTSLVVSAADAGPASEFLRKAGQIHRYGEFYFETVEDWSKDFLKPARSDFTAAFKEAINAVRPTDGLIGVDRTNDDLLWDLCREILGEHRIADVTRCLGAARATKSPGEIARLREATRLVEDGFRRIIKQAHPGMTEIDLAAMITEGMVAGGGIPRFVSVTSGPRSALADTYSTRRVIAKGETIRIDAGCTVDGYWSDMARTFLFGEPDTRQKTTYAALLAGLEEQLATVRAGVPANVLFDVAMKAVRSNGLPHYKRQHCGHGIGLRSYDSPTVNATDTTVLLEGMCLCLETPYYKLGLDGMMVEDTIRVTADGFEPITTLSRELFVLS
ncbi:M24 family metallopeptidase [Chelatococcus asaccharovorans]|uniref:Xaa-Pro aminopeptidase n=1 Tax=Chelatococcus asaccharovorans TaxID=28210 RepID=A0A2V3U8F0_9HYPH|nr:Xaa-Pro peptidase family protein [Chelatococcus asaccharovorans]MBS7705508.1 aminopeptidase P family protein [Chelatococcus asaccharovorans]PXW60087.1 Xaa-Pro aminopeptidase [Chelatococcus asaccharovorans]